MHLIREHGAGVLLVSHELSAVADDVDRVIVLKRSGAVRRAAVRAGRRGVVSLGVHREDLPLWLEELS